MRAWTLFQYIILLNKVLASNMHTKAGKGLVYTIIVISFDALRVVNPLEAVSVAV